MAFLSSKHKTLTAVLLCVASRVSEVAQWVRVPATKLATLSSIPGTRKIEGENGRVVFRVSMRVHACM